MRTPQSHLVRDAVMREPEAGRHIHIRPRHLAPECLDRIDALADRHGLERGLVRRIATELHR